LAASFNYFKEQKLTISH